MTIQTLASQYKSAKPNDLSYLARLAQKQGGANRYKRVYKGEGSAKLLLKEAWYLKTEQNAYDDTSIYAVPFTGEVNAASMNNLGEFCNCLITANGLAGFGSTWSASLDKENGVIILRERSSIAD